MKAIVLFLALSIILVPSAGYAYIDPGTGSMVLQIVAATFLGAIFTIKSFWRNIKAYLSGIFKRPDSN